MFFPATILCYTSGKVNTSGGGRAGQQQALPNTGDLKISSYVHLVTQGLSIDLNCNTIHVHQEASPIAFNRSYFAVDMHRIVPQEAWL